MKRSRAALVGSVLRVASLGATTLVGFVLMPFLVHRLGDRIYGYWALVAAVLGYYGILDLGIVTAVQYKVAKSIGDRDHDSANRSISTAFYTFAVLGLIALILSITIAVCARLFIRDPSDASQFRTVMLIMGLGFALGFPGRVFVGAIAAHMRFDFASSISIFVLILRATLVILIVGAGGGIISLALISLGSEGIGYILNYLILRHIQENLKLSVALASYRNFKELFNYSGYALVIQISDQLRFSLDGWMVALFVGVGAVTHYSIASRLSQAFLALVIASVGMLSPWFSQLLGSSDFPGIRRVFIVGTKISAIISTTVASALLLYGYVFIERWMGPSYTDAYWPLVILLAGIYCDVAQLPSVSYMFGVSRHRFLALVTLAEGVSNLCLSIYWAPRYGMIGVALGSLVPMAAAKLLLQPAYVCKCLDISLREYYFGLLGRAIAAPALCSIIVWLTVSNLLHFPSVAVISAAIACQTLLCGCIGFLFAFDRSERIALLSRVPGLRLREAQFQVS